MPGKTRTQILNLLYADVRSVVQDTETTRNIWENWTGQDNQTQEESNEEKFQAQIAQLNKELNESAVKNRDMWNQIFLILKFGGKEDYDAEAVAGFYLMREDATPTDAWLMAGQGIVAYQKLQKRSGLTPDELEQMKELTIKTIGCNPPQNCAALHHGMKQHAARVAKAALPTFFLIKMFDKDNLEKMLGAFIAKLSEGFQEMEFYDPYKIEAECLEDGGDELGCFKSTYFGLFGYGLFGKQADDEVSIDKKSLDLVNRWKEERFKKFQCIDGDCNNGMELKP